MNNMSTFKSTTVNMMFLNNRLMLLLLFDLLSKTELIKILISTNVEVGYFTRVHICHHLKLHGYEQRFKNKI